jgi:biopolymer transport protein ExbD
MSIELIIAIVAVAVIAVILVANRKKGVKSADVNKDGQVTVEDAKAALQNTVDTVKEVVDVNKDGQVTIEDAKAGGSQAVETVKKTARRASGKRASKKSTS